ncbi:hypothetical protein HDA32_005368 [Spinactinospora alkalitolerans]|uniref:Uncharacterized protein n=1 Tax=Spinactinospora alkalitolerans TaxID=687207 RepID=A0A852U212_9ACTN|nr:hypothetical protein [Spinactinospora alkalitolerans]NYE50248.1 hypothetical protein [Spinactinospora alkalitolerans]
MATTTPSSDPLLAILREHYAGRWRIRRTDHLWIATTVDRRTEHAPTVAETDVEEFVRQLEDPPARAGRSLLDRGWMGNRLEQIGDGVYSSPEQPQT